MGFLVGFIGAAPFAWSLLSDQLASGAFVRGLWYFFGIVIAAGIFAGIAGLGLGYIGGVLWEQLHRHRRREKLQAKALAESQIGTSPGSSQFPSEIGGPRLKLVSLDSVDLPDLDGRTLSSVRFHGRGLQLDLSGVRLEVVGNPLIILGAQRTRFPEPGSRDALCSLIGDKVVAQEAQSERIEIHFSSGAELVIPRNAVQVA